MPRVASRLGVNVVGVRSPLKNQELFGDGSRQVVLWGAISAHGLQIAQGEWTCTVADFTGTMRGPMKGSDGKLIAPTNKKFRIEFCTVAHWKNGEIVEEKLFYDLVGLLKQIGVM